MNIKPTRKPQRRINRKVRVMASLLAISALGVSMITGWEGIETSAYKDGVNVTTIGVGSTYYPAGTTYTRNGTERTASTNEKVIMGDRITTKEAKRVMGHTVDNTYAASVRRCVNVPLSQGEFDAYSSLAYNIGSHAFCTSTLVKLVNMRQYSAACAQLLRWNRSGGKVVQGLVNRRQDEFKLCIGDSGD